MSASTFDQIRQNLLDRKIEPIYFFYGTEPWFINQLVDLAEEKILNPGEEAFNKTILYGNECNGVDVVGQVRRFPMMAERQLVIVKEAHRLTGFGDLEPIITKPVTTTTLILVYRKEAMDGRLKIFKEMKKNAVVFESKPLYDNQWSAWLKKYLADHQVTVPAEGQHILIESIGGDLEKIENAVAKLKILQKDAALSTESIRDVVGISRKYSMFELQDAIGERRMDAAMHIVEVMIEDLSSNPPQMIIPSLFSYLSKLYAIKQLGSQRDRIKKALGIYVDFIVNKYVKAASKYRIDELEEMIHLLRSYDLKLKGIHSQHLDMDVLFREMMLKILYHPHSQSA